MGARAISQGVGEAASWSWRLKKDVVAPMAGAAARPGGRARPAEELCSCAMGEWQVADAGGARRSVLGQGASHGGSRVTGPSRMTLAGERREDGGLHEAVMARKRKMGIFPKIVRDLPFILDS